MVDEAGFLVESKTAALIAELPADEAKLVAAESIVKALGVTDGPGFDALIEALTAEGGSGSLSNAGGGYITGMKCRSVPISCSLLMASCSERTLTVGSKSGAAPAAADDLQMGLRATQHLEGGAWQGVDGHALQDRTDLGHVSITWQAASMVIISHGHATSELVVL